MRSAFVIAALLNAAVLLFTAGCGDSTTAKDNERDKSEEQTKTSDNDPRFHERLLEIAAEYQKYGLVNPAASVAPARCAAASSPIAPVSLSKSSHAGTHGKKLFFLFAKNDIEYATGAADEAAAEGQTLVKESWTAEECEAESVKEERHLSGHEVLPFVIDDEKKCYKTGEQRELFVMFRTKADMPGTDNGWVYGTVTADGKTVTSSGVVESCARCHKKAGDDRLFGADDKPKVPTP